VSELFLGIIAGAVLVMAIIQVTAIVFAARAARRVGDAVSRLEQDVRPIVSNLQNASATLSSEVKPIMANLQSMSADAAHASSVAAAQVDRADQLITDLSTRVDQTFTSLQDSILRPAREGFAIFQGLKAAFSAFGGRPARSERPRKRPATAEEEDALFIG
jgi:hypothetical protein